MGLAILEASNYTQPTRDPTRQVCMNVLQTQANNSSGVAALTALQIPLTTEVSCFAYSISADGTTLTPRSSNLPDSSVVSAVHAVSGKKVTWSFGGGSQNVSDISTAISTNKAVTVGTVVAKTLAGGYDGVKLDIENTAVASNVIPDFISALRTAFNAQPSINQGRAIISLDVQPSAWQNVYSQINTVEPQIDNVYVMVYDIASYTTDTIKQRTAQWVNPMNGQKGKISPGMAIIDANSRVLSTTEMQEICYWVLANNYAGIMVWNNYNMSPEYYTIIDNMF